jgi:hypothetical protein
MQTRWIYQQMTPGHSRLPASSNKNMIIWDYTALQIFWLMQKFQLKGTKIVMWKVTMLLPAR